MTGEEPVPAGSKLHLLLGRLTVRAGAIGGRLWPVTGLALGVLSGFLLLATKIAPIERDYLDLLMKQRAVRVLDGPDSPVTVVAYDDRDAQLYGKDVDRAALDRVVRKILASSPKVVVLDLQFSEGDRPAQAVSRVLDEVKERVPRTPDRVVEELRLKYDATATLLDTLSSGPVVGAFFGRGISAQPREFETLPPDSMLIDSEGCDHFYAPVHDLVLDDPEFLKRIPYYGNVRLEIDSDGQVRRYNLFTRIGPTIYPSLALIAAALHHETPMVQVECQGARVSGFSIGTGDPSRFDLLHSSDAGFLVDFGGTFDQSFPNHVTFRSILSDEGVPPDRFAGKAVLVGLKNPYQDKYPTLHDPVFPGVAIHATVAHDLITGHQLRRNDYLHETILEPLLCVLVGGVVTAFFVFFERAWILILSPIFAIAGHVGTVKLLGAGYVVNLLGPGLVGAFGILACGAMRLVIDQRIADRERRRAEAQRLRAEREELRAESERLRAEHEKGQREASERELSAFLSPSVAQLVIENPGLLQPVRQEISILFSDIRKFTTVAEGMSPEALADMLKEYLTWMTEIVLSNHGTLDKYIGDAVMALFGAPLTEQAHARWACLTALEMMEALDALHERWRERGKPLLQIGIGINTGPVIVGKMGSKRKAEYTCIGDDVNFASRAEGLTKVYGTSIIVGEATRQQAGEDFVFRDLGPVKVQGKTKGVRIYELVGTRAAVTDTGWIDVFHRGLNAFLLRDWDTAEALFERVLETRGRADGPSKAFMVWTRSFRAHPPDEAWDGALERAGK